MTKLKEDAPTNNTGQLVLSTANDSYAGKGIKRPLKRKRVVKSYKDFALAARPTIHK